MAKIDSGSKSSRLLASRRYTHDTLNTAQESFTNVLDIQSEEIYTQAAKIPSSGLPFSGSSQSGSFYTDGGENILKYWYRHSLTKSNLNNETWFFLSPSGSNSGVGAQLINDNQEVNFVSPKYSISSLATSTVEDSTPGYLAVLYKATHATSESLDSGDIVSTNDYIFDYKTGVVQFMNSSVDPTDSDYVYMSVYQYVGNTLSTGLELDGSVSGSATSTGSFGLLLGDGSQLSGGIVSSSVPSSPSQGTIRLSTNGVNTDVDSGLQIGDSPTFAGISLTGDGSVTGSLVLTGTLTAQEYVVSSSVTYLTQSFSSGSTVFGDDTSDTHQFTGSIYVSGSYITIRDNTTLGIGDSNDLQLYHDGSNSYIKDNGTGNLFYRGGTQTFQNAAGSKTMLTLNAANSVDLSFNNNTKFQTTNTGVSVTGNVVASGYITGSYISASNDIYAAGNLRIIGNISGSSISSSGDILADGDVVAYNSSDERLKDNIEVIQGSLDKIGEIRGVEFDWNEKSPGWAQERGHDVGVIAQEVQKVLPEIVTKRKNGYLGVDYKRLVPLLIESIKELKEEVEILKKKVN